MPTERWGHSCGLVSDPERGPEVIVFGGYHYDEYLDSVDIYSIGTNSWRAGIKTSNTHHIFIRAIINLRLTSVP